VRLARAGEKFLALDGRTYQLTEQNLVIADNDRAVGIAGVMGGEDTGVTAATRSVLLESAYFLPTSVRRTARTLNLPSDSSYRFERGVDPGMVLPASQRASEMIRELAAGQPQDEIAVAGELPANPPNIALRYARANRLIGTRIEHQRMDEILVRFGLQEVGRATDLESWWRVPSHRRDLMREEDLIEEIVRAFGVNAIPSANRSRFTPSSDADRTFDFQMRVRQRLTACGFSEARTSVLLPRGTTSFSTTAVALRNPLSEDHVALRPSLLPGLLDVLERNLRAGVRSVRLFELGRVFTGSAGVESRHLALLLNGNTAEGTNWRKPEARRLDFFDAKGALEALDVAELSFRRANRSDLAIAAEIFIDKDMIGIVGQLTAAEATRFGAAGPVVIAELQIEPLLVRAEHATRFGDIDRFPAVTRDIAMVVPEMVSHEQIVRAIESANQPLLANVELFDLFSGKGAESLGSGRKSMAYTLTYRDKNRTLTNDEVTVVHTRIRERLKSELGAELRE
jgi:phenylalanyl-tRNA synthetase beta chain